MARAYSTTNKIKYVEFSHHVEGIMPNGTIFKIDKEDYEFVKDKAWHNLDGYMYHHKLGLMHRVLLTDQLQNDLEVDHINRDRMDNRRCNLRVVTRQENMKNKSMYKTNSSGYKGVKWNKTKNKWQVQITVNKNRMELGSFYDLQDAIAVRRKAESEFL